MPKLKNKVLIAGMLLISSITLGQRQEDHFLRDYISPEFRLRQLSLTGNGSGDVSSSSASSSSDFTLNTILSYYQIRNSKKFQGVLNPSFYFNYSYHNGITESFIISSGLRNTCINRFYFNDRWFWGLSDESQIRQRYLSFDSITPMNMVTYEFRPAISIGFGRIEWVQFARQAMDIEQSLNNVNRLHNSFSENEKKLLADKIALIRNRRYYDSRLGRIDQLQSLDSLLSRDEFITTADIIYFCELQDAFLYSYYTTRLSGRRHEFGITQSLNSSNTSTTGQSLAFYSFTWYLPQSYAIQHDFKVSALGGYAYGSTSATQGTFPAWADMSYTFGLYPTTRTYAGITANTGINYEGDFGYVYGIRLNGYYYIAPRFRFWADCNFTQGENYSSHGFNIVAVSNSSRGNWSTDFSFNAGIYFDVF